MLCPVCGVEFVQARWNKRFCSYACYDKSVALRSCKETFRLSAKDLALRSRLRL
jgi:hypothetical protein